MDPVLSQSGSNIIAQVLLYSNSQDCQASIYTFSLNYILYVLAL